MGGELRWFSRWDVIPEGSPVHPARTLLWWEVSTCLLGKGTEGESSGRRTRSLMQTLSCDPEEGTNAAPMAGVGLQETADLGRDKGAPGLGGVSVGGHRLRAQDGREREGGAGVRGATGWQGSPGASRHPTCSQGGQDPDPRPTFISQPGTQPFSPAPALEGVAGQQGPGSVCPDLSLQDSGATPGGQDGRGASTWPVVRSSSNSTWMRTGQHGHSASRQGRAAQQKAWVPLGPQTALSTGPLPGTGFWQRVSAVPLQRCHPGHSTVAMAGLPLTPVPRAPQHRSRVQLWLGAEGGGVQGPGQVPRQPWERMPAARTSLTG